MVVVPSTIRPGTACNISVVIMEHVTSDVTVNVALNVGVNDDAGITTTMPLSLSETCEPGQYV